MKQKDTSLFVLRDELAKIARLNDILCFSPLSTHVGDGIHPLEFSDQVDDKNHRFFLWPRSVMLSSSISFDDRVFRMLVYRSMPPARPVRNISYEWLILQRSTAGGNHLYPYIMNADFKMEVGAMIFNSCEVTVKMDPDDSLEFRPTDKFPIDFRNAILKWVEDSIEVRTKAINDLTRFKLSYIFEPHQ